MFATAYPDSRSRFASHHQNGFSISFLKNPSNNDKEMTGLYVLGSSNGLVLCTTDLFKQTYYVCDPLTMKLVLLPPPPRKSKWVVNGFICNDDEESTNFKVVRMSRLRKPNKFSVEIFSSDVSEWNSYRVVRPDDVTPVASFCCHPIIHNGVIYLVEKQNWVLAFNLNNKTSSLIKLPGVESAEDESNLPPDEYCNRHCLGVSEGMICFGTIKRIDLTLSVWVLKGLWHLLHKDSISEDMLAEIESLLFGRAGSSCFTRDDFSRDIKVLGFNPLNQNVVMLGSGKFIWSYNIRTRRYKQLCEPSFLSTAHSLS